jgi:hypothetical protein
MGIAEGTAENLVKVMHMIEEKWLAGANHVDSTEDSKFK